MNPQQESVVRLLLQQLITTAMALDEILNPEDDEPEQQEDEAPRPRVAFLGQDDN